MKAFDPEGKSRIRKISGENGPVIEKIHVRSQTCQREAELYRILKERGIRTPELLGQEGNRLVLSFVDGEDYVSLLERQEKEEYDSRPWDALLEWIVSFAEKTGLIQNDMNLRNFLFYDGSAYGIDFEECLSGDPAEMLGELAAYVLLYDPCNTPLKQRIVQKIQETASQCGYCREQEFSRILQDKTAQLKEHRKQIAQRRNL